MEDRILDERISRIFIENVRKCTINQIVVEEYDVYGVTEGDVTIKLLTSYDRGYVKVDMMGEYLTTLYKGKYVEYVVEDLSRLHTLEHETTVLLDTIFICGLNELGELDTDIPIIRKLSNMLEKLLFPLGMTRQIDFREELLLRRLGYTLLRTSDHSITITNASGVRLTINCTEG